MKTSVKNFLSFGQARDVVHRFNIRSVLEWNLFCKVGKRPRNIPSCPHLFYNKKEWKGYGDWLGTGVKSCRIRKYTANDDYFKKWFPNMAYILGFWWADGHISIDTAKSSYKFEICQHKDDRYLLENIRNEIAPNAPIYEHGQRAVCTLRICSKEIVQDIIKKGGTERKSLTVGFPEVPEDFLSDFIRGIWDGDGCICWNKHDKSYRSSFVSGSQKLIYKLFDVLKKKIKGIGGTITKNGNTYQLGFSKNDTAKLKLFLYKNVELNNNRLFLKRKYVLFKKVAPPVSFLEFKDAREYVKGLGFNSVKEWKEFSKNKRPNFIPSHPQDTYGNNGWISWNNWFGKID